MFRNEEKEAKVNTRGDQVNGLLDKGCSFEGKLTFDGTVQINGDFDGEIYSDGTLVVGNEAKVKAKIFVDTLITYGKLEGEVEAKSRIEMHVPAVVVANVNTKSLSIEDGVIFEGQCHMEQSGMRVVEASSDKAAGRYEKDAEAADSDEDVLVM